MSAGSFNQTVEMTMKKMMVAAAVLAVSGSAFAEGKTDKIYVEAGWAQINVDFASVYTNVDDTDDTFSLGIGYNINENISIEAGVTGATKVSATLPSGTYTVEGVSGTVTANNNPTAVAETDEVYALGAKFTLPVTGKLDLYAKAGLLWWDLDYRLTSGSITHGGATYTSLWYSEDGSDPYYGLGVAYSFDNNLGLRGGWMRTEVGDADVDLLSASISYQF
jgi:hypothetical protein